MTDETVKDAAENLSYALIEIKAAMAAIYCIVPTDLDRSTESEALDFIRHSVEIHHGNAERALNLLWPTIHEHGSEKVPIDSETDCIPSALVGQTC
jgi:hypothetical protein